jgi:hypothetical protein
MSVIIDEVHKFWLKKIPLIEKEMDLITGNGDSMLLSGAIYLDYKDNDHYIYKSLGTNHFLYDSIIKLEDMIRMPEKTINHNELSKLFKKAYDDVILILKNTRSHFYYVPLTIMIHKTLNNEYELMNNAFWGVISSLFDKQFVSKADFTCAFSTYEEIEKSLSPSHLKHIITLSENDRKIPLRKRMENYYNAQPFGQEFVKQNTDSSIFIMTMFGLISQVLSILLTSTIYNLIPFIRYNITFHYLSLLMGNFFSDTTMKNKIEKSIITYLFYHRVDKKFFKNINFDNYCHIATNFDLFSKIKNDLEEKQINIFTNGIKKTTEIIDKNIDLFFNSFNM